MCNIIKITDFNSPELDIYARLSEVELKQQFHPAPGIFIAESPKVIERALNDFYEPISILVETKQIDKEAKDIIERCGNIPIYTAEFDILTKLTGFKLTRGMLCAMKRKTLPTVNSICSNASRIAVLENIMNPTNIGAIFRSAAALNIDAILLTSGCSDPLYRRSERVSMGTVFQIPWTYFPSLSDKYDYYTDFLHEFGFKTVAMALSDNSISIDNPILKKIDKLAIILGTEGDGLNAKTISNCDYTVKIPMTHGVDSLNVAAASAVAFWEMSKH